MATHSSILAWKIPCTKEEPGRLQSIGLQKVGHDGSNLAHMRHPLIKLFHLSNLLQMPNDHRMVDVEFFTTSCVVVRGLPLMNFSIGRSLSPYDSWPLLSSSSRLSYAKLETALQCTLAMYKCIFDVVSCFCCIMTHFQLT